MRNLIILPAFLLILGACSFVPDLFTPVSSQLTPAEIEALGSVRSKADLARADLLVKQTQFAEYAERAPCSAARVTFCSDGRVVVEGVRLLDDVKAALDAADTFLDPVSGLPDLSSAEAQVAIARTFLTRLARILGEREAGLPPAGADFPPVAGPRGLALAFAVPRPGGASW